MLNTYFIYLGMLNFYCTNGDMRAVCYGTECGALWKCRDRKARKREAVVLAKMGSIRYKTALGFWGT